MTDMTESTLKCSSGWAEDFGLVFVDKTRTEAIESTVAESGSNGRVAYQRRACQRGQKDFCVV